MNDQICLLMKLTGTELIISNRQFEKDNIDFFSIAVNYLSKIR